MIFGKSYTKLEDKAYEIVYQEISENKLNPSSQARAIEEGGASKEGIQQAYIKHRKRQVLDALLEEEKRKKEEQQAAKKRAFVNERINEENKRRQAAHDQAKKDGRTDAQIELDEKIKDTRKNYDARMGAWLLVIPLFIIWTLGLGFSAMIEILDGW